MATRRSTHSSSWYTANRVKLDLELSEWLSAVESNGEFSPPYRQCKAIIAPHAGYTYSGRAAAWAYKCIDPTNIKRVFILGPSHHAYLDGCALSTCAQYDTPLGPLPLDTDTIAQLRTTGIFSDMDIRMDEEEHSIEMHLPYIRKVFKGLDIKIVPILVGSIEKAKEEIFALSLKDYFMQNDTLFVISSDFCHWGTRFSYTTYYPAPPPCQAIRLTRTNSPSEDHPIHASISALDHEAMNLLSINSDIPGSATQAHVSFVEYLSRTKNTICGRHPIGKLFPERAPFYLTSPKSGVLLGILAVVEATRDQTPADNASFRLQWVRYEQSSRCLTVKDSSVSYASGFVAFF